MTCEKEVVCSLHFGPNSKPKDRVGLARRRELVIPSKHHVGPVEAAFRGWTLRGVRVSADTLPAMIEYAGRVGAHLRPWGTPRWW